jgi:NAD(P)-dependent dehydrogenase (short-subunit alcohol dehydrogenase family)
MNSLRFDGRVAIVTGAGGGLGSSHARMLAARGAKVVVNDLGTSVDGRDALSPAADAVAEEIRAAGAIAIANAHDISNPDGATRLIEQTLDAFGRIDILVNNAGILRDKTFAKMSLADFQRVLDVHLLGAVYCTKGLWARMIEQGYGRVIFTTSSSGLYGHFGQSNYSAAKLGLVGFMKSLVQEGRRHGVLTNAVAPLAATRMSVGKLNEDVFKQMPPEHVSALVTYLASEQCDLSGGILVAGGGYLARAEMVEAAGVVMRSDNPSPEAIREALAAASDLAQAIPYPSLAAAFDAAAAKLEDAGLALPASSS